MVTPHRTTVQVGWTVRHPANCPQGKHPTDSFDLAVEWIGQQDEHCHVILAGTRRDGSVVAYSSFDYGDEFLRVRS